MWSTLLCPSVTRHSIYYDTNSCHVDYCSSLLIGSPRSVTDKLQCILNAAARVITNTTKFDTGLSSILHHDLHWLDVTERIQDSSIPEGAVFSHCCISRSLWQASVCIFWWLSHTMLQNVNLRFPCILPGWSSLREFSAWLLRVTGPEFWLF